MGTRKWTGVFLCYFVCWVNFSNSNKNTETPNVEFLFNLKNIIDRTVSVSQSGTFQVAQRAEGLSIGSK